MVRDDVTVRAVAFSNNPLLGWNIAVTFLALQTTSEDVVRGPTLRGDGTAPFIQAVEGVRR
jgi:hypothetical protein